MTERSQITQQKMECLRAQCRKLERDRDKGWEIARWWQHRVHEINIEQAKIVQGCSPKVTFPLSHWWKRVFTIYLSIAAGAAFVFMFAVWIWSLAHRS